jgi:hypothetical protein
VGWWAAGIAQLVRTGWFRQVHLEAEASHAVRAPTPSGGPLGGPGNAGDPDPLGADALRSGEPDPRRAETFGLVVGKSPSRLVKRAYELVADELAEKPDFASLVENLLPPFGHRPNGR